MLSLMDHHKDAYFHATVALKISHFLIDDLIEFTESLAFRDSFTEKEP